MGEKVFSRYIECNMKNHSVHIEKSFKNKSLKRCVTFKYKFKFNNPQKPPKSTQIVPKINIATDSFLNQ